MSPHGQFAVGLAFALGACSLPSDEQVRREFLQDHPTAVILDLYVGEGDNDHAYYTIKYRDTLDHKDYRACWLYSDYQTKEWHVMHKGGAVPEPAPSGYCR